MDDEKKTLDAAEEIEELEPVVIVDGSKREIKYPVMSVMKMEKTLGCSSLELLKKDEGDPFSLRELVIILWAGLLASLPRLTVQKTVEFVEDPDFDFDMAVNVCKQELFKSMMQILRFKKRDEDVKN